MRILVISDTHRDYYSAIRAVQQQPGAEVILHLGDGADEAERLRRQYSEKMVVSVRGNCDWGVETPPDALLRLENKTIYMTHGHLYNVKMSYYPLCCAARERHADIVLFGHTHTPVADYDDGLYLMNPGSLRDESYGIVDITPAGIVTNLLKLR